MRRAVVALALAALAGPACARKEPPPAGSAPAPSASAAHRLSVDPSLLASGRVVVAPVEKRAPRPELRLAGEVLAAASAEAEAGTLVAGRVAQVLVAVGDKVDKGQPLAWIDAPDVGRATAELLRARARAAVAGRKLERQLALEAEHATSPNAVDEARAEADTARADLAAARTLLASLGAPEPAAAASGASAVAARLPVRAPIAGTVVERTATLGAPVTAERSLFRVVGGEGRVVRALLPETSRAVVDAAAAAVLVPRAGRAEASPERCDARLAGDVGVVDEATRAVPLRLVPTGPCPFLLPGGFVDVIVRTSVPPGAGEAVVVPRDAIVELSAVPTVFVASGPEGSFVPRGVRAGETIGDDTIVEAGLAPGERVAVRGALLLKGEAMRAELGE
jgi:cobalt-zinc-cadmium efflux system membrane fusion protein